MLNTKDCLKRFKFDYGKEVFSLFFVFLSLSFLMNSSLVFANDSLLKVGNNNLQLKKLNIVEISTGKLYFFQLASKYRLKALKVENDFIGIKNADDRIVDIYIDAHKIPFPFQKQLSQLDKDGPLEDRVRVGQMIIPKLFKFTEYEEAIGIGFQEGAVEVGSIP